VFGFSDGKKRAWLYGQGIVSHEEQTDDGEVFTVEWTRRQKGAFQRLA